MPISPRFVGSLDARCKKEPVCFFISLNSTTQPSPRIPCRESARPCLSPYRLLFESLLVLLEKKPPEVDRSEKSSRFVGLEENRLGSSGLLLLLLLLVELVLPLPLDLVHEVVVTLVEVVDADVAVLTAAGVALAGRVGGDRVEGTEVTAHATNLALEDLVIETGLEFTLASRGGGDIHSGLTTTEDDVVLLAGDGSAVERGVGGVGLEDLEVLGCDELLEVRRLACGYPWYNVGFFKGPFREKKG